MTTNDDYVTEYLSDFREYMNNELCDLRSRIDKIQTEINDFIAPEELIECCNCHHWVPSALINNTITNAKEESFAFCIKDDCIAAGIDLWGKSNTRLNLQPSKSKKANT